MTILAIFAQAMAVIVLMVRKGWRTVPMLFWAEMIQATIMLAFYLLPNDSPLLFHLWHDDNKVSFLLYLFVAATYFCHSREMRNLSVMCLAANCITVALYNPLTSDSQLIADGLLYHFHVNLSIFIDLYVAATVYTLTVGNPHKENVCQNRSRKRSPNRLNP